MADQSLRQNDWMVEQALPEDAKKIAEMHSNSFQKAYLKPGDESHNAIVIEAATAFLTPARLEKRAELLAHSLEHPETDFYQIIMDDDGKAAGLIYGVKLDKIQEIEALYVDEKYHGSGVAQALVEAYVEWADPTRPIELGVVVDNDRAKKFYKKMGFEALSDKRPAFYSFLPETTMERKGNQQSAEYEPAPRFEINEMTVDEIDEASLMRMQSWIDTYVNVEYGVDETWIRERFKEKLDPATKHLREDRFTSALAAGTFKAWVARDRKGELIGSTTPFISEDGTQRIGSIYVDEAWHGNGVGAQLMQRVIDWFDPAKPIQLEVVSYNERAKAFYKKWGFQEVPGSEALYDGKIPEIRMIRQPESGRE
ncbi:MAG: GNAT family N-acetyltransferase [Candidatus Microsaccharimonas sp.]